MARGCPIWRASIPPPGLKEEIRAYRTTLADEKMIELADSQMTLPYYLAVPVCNQDPKKAKQLMIADGYLKPQERQ